METPTLTPVVSATPKQKKPMTEAQLESLARAREKALEVRRAKAAAKKTEAENPPELEPVFHGETPPTPPAPRVPTGPSEDPTPPNPTPPPPVRQNASSSEDSESEEDRIEAEVQRRLKKMKEKKKEKKHKKRPRFVVEESESSESEEGEVVLVRKKPRTVPQRPVFHQAPNPFHSTFPRPGSSFRRY